MWDKEGAGAAHLSAGAQGAGGLCTGASGSFHPATNMSQPSPFTTKLQVTSGHLEPKINSSPRFKIEIKLDLRTKMYVYNSMPQGLMHAPPLFFSSRHLLKCTRKNIHFCFSILLIFFCFSIFWHLQHFWTLILWLLKGLDKRRLAKTKWYSLMIADKNNDKCNLK